MQKLSLQIIALLTATLISGNSAAQQSHTIQVSWTPPMQPVSTISHYVFGWFCDKSGYGSRVIASPTLTKTTITASFGGNCNAFMSTVDARGKHSPPSKIVRFVAP